MDNAHLQNKIASVLTSFCTLSEYKAILAAEAILNLLHDEYTITLKDEESTDSENEQ